VKLLHLCGVRRPAGGLCVWNAWDEITYLAVQRDHVTCGAVQRLYGVVDSAASGRDDVACLSVFVASAQMNRRRCFRLDCLMADDSLMPVL